MTRSIFIAALCLMSSACGTTLSVGERARNDTSDPAGIVVNTRRMYTATVKTLSKDLEAKVAKIGPFMAVDVLNVLVLNVERMVFSSGKLKLTLDGDETITEASITSETGAASVVNVGKTGVESRNKIVEDK